MAKRLQCFMSKKAFSLFEILLVLAIIGILGAVGYVIYPQSLLNLAQEQIVNHLNYTRFLALNSSKQITQNVFCQSDFCQEERERYQESFWRLQFADLKNIGWAYSVFSDSARSSKTKNFDDRPMDSFEVARDSMSGKYLSVYTYNNTKFANGLREGDLSISKRYGVSKVQMYGGCGKQNGGRILFDDLGFVRCKKSGEKVSYPDSEVILELMDNFGASVRICISENGLVEKC